MKNDNGFLVLKRLCTLVFVMVLSINLMGQAAPTATTNAATGISAYGATLNGTVNANGSSTAVSFQYGLDTGYGHTITADQNPVTGSVDTAVSVSIYELLPNTTYHFRVVAVNINGTTYGGDMTFTTSAVAPIAVTLAASGIGPSGATLNGSINANNAGTTVTFEYGLTTAYGSTVTADQSPVGGSGSIAVSKAISGLTTGATYHFRVVGQNAGGTSYGSDLTFTTGALPTVTTNAASAVGATTASLNGSVNANGSTTTVTFQYGTGTSFDRAANAVPNVVTGSGNTAVSASLSGLIPRTLYHFRAVGVTSGGNTVYGGDLTFSTLAIPPTAVTNSASGVTGTGAALNGTVNANNSSTTVTFQYGLTAAYGTTVTAAQSPVSGYSNGAVTAAIGGLTDNTTYHYRVVAQNSSGTTYGGDITFATGTAAPTAATNAASAVTSNSASLNGTVNANNDSTSVTFEYDLTTAYRTSVTADQSPVTGISDTAVSHTITGLSPSTTYHYRVVGQNSRGTTYGGDQTFTTLNPPPTVITGAASGISDSGATLNGTVNANNESTAVTFEYGLTTAYGSTVTAAPSPVTGSTATAVSAAISGLTVHTTYHYRVVGSSISGTSYGDDMSFTTSALAPSVTTGVASGITTSGATLNGTVNAYNDSTAVSFEYGLTTAYGSTVTAVPSPVSGLTDTAVSAAISGLSPDTTYHFRAVGTNTAGSTYGGDMTFTTPSPLMPTVKTRAISDITASSASGGGTVTDGGSAFVSARGVCWGTSPNPTIAGSHSVDGSGTGVFSSLISGLTEKVSYYARAYASNSFGTAYGDQFKFTTGAAALTVNITNPADGAVVEGTVSITATVSPVSIPAAAAESPVLAVSKVEFFIDDVKVADFTADPYEFPWVTTTYADGSHSIKAVAYNINNESSQDTITVTVSNGTPQLSVNRDRLNFGAVPGSNGGLTFSSSSAGGFITTGSQWLLIDNLGGGSLNWTASPDSNWLSCTPTFGSGAGLVEVSVDPSGMNAGTFTASITVKDSGNADRSISVAVRLVIYAGGSSTVPFGSFDSPTDGASVMSSIPVTGWALDDIEITGVKIYRDPVGNEGSGLVFIGDAALVDGARPDLEQTYPAYPFDYRAGWGYMLLTNFLPNQGNGSFTLYALATDKEGNSITLGSKIITCDNAHAVKPFGAIDSPSQGGSAAGSTYVNAGWVLTPLPNSIPVDSSIKVWIDGVPLENHAVYNLFRSDVADLFPGYNNSGGAGGYFYLDTTPYSNGVHTVAWSVSDDAGNSDGIGCRFFSILNLDSPASQTQSAAASNAPGRFFSRLSDLELIPWLNPGPISFKKGFDAADVSMENGPNNKGFPRLYIKELQPVDISLGENIAAVQGFLVVDGKLRPLPVGSSLRQTPGKFSWLPGPGFIGKYSLVFVIKDTSGQYFKKLIEITIEPKY